MAQGGSNKKVANSLVALSSAAVMAVYAAGYIRTRGAADRLEAQAAERRPAVPEAPPVPAAAESTGPAPIAAVNRDVVKAVKPGATKVDTPSVEAEPVAAPVADPPVEVAAPIVSPVVEQKAEVAPAAPPVAAPAPPPAAPAAPMWKDGTYYGWGTSRHGDIQAAVVIEGGRITSATIAQCLTRYSCSVISNLPPEVAQRQSPEVDFVSGATQSANAFYYGVVEALSKAK